MKMLRANALQPENQSKKKKLIKHLFIKYQSDEVRKKNDKLKLQIIYLNIFLYAEFYFQ